MAAQVTPAHTHGRTHSLAGQTKDERIPWSFRFPLLVKSVFSGLDRTPPPPKKKVLQQLQCPVEAGSALSVTVITIVLHRTLVGNVTFSQQTLTSRSYKRVTNTVHPPRKESETSLTGKPASSVLILGFMLE